ncbi:MAG: GNAT family N-acetyltransferase [Candidatus Bathyarchaeota archaeon]|jgi:GNAT superfamily N-acetyltransferase|nr:GNAT family N-acetyltransferase [Candidatus Bathyarchaeota archaeon A05DMB-5]MDH7558339.1 GNAT family N-acetyltransferase [Candidatus Bathyarchaeota archaeon]
MSLKRSEISNVEFYPLTPERWVDLEKLFGERGACGGCWCMWWKLKRSDFMRQKGELNRKALKEIVDSGEASGILAYANGEPIGWCAVAPREAYPALERSRVLKRVDDKPVWSVVCFFVAKPFRGKGLTVQLLKAAVAHVRRQGGKIVEGYPVEPKKGRMPDPFAYTGLVSSFRKAGFVEVLRRSENRPIMRYFIAEK